MDNSCSYLVVRYCEQDEDSVADVDLQLYPYEARVSNEPQINPMITVVQQCQIANLLEEKEAIFSSRPGHTTQAVHSSNTGDAKPIYYAPYRIPTAWQHKVRQEIQQMLDEGIITPSTSAWTSPVVPVKKKGGSLRLCVDYRKLNSVMQEDRYHMPRVDETLEKLGRASYISTLDLTQGYYQVPVAAYCYYCRRVLILANFSDFVIIAKFCSDIKMISYNYCLKSNHWQGLNTGPSAAELMFHHKIWYLVKTFVYKAEIHSTRLAS